MQFRTVALLVLASLLPAARAHADAVDDIRKAGRLVCSVSQDVDDYSQYDAHGDLSAFGSDLCGAVAAALLGDPHKAAIRARPDEITALQELQHGRAQVMFAATPDPALGFGLHLAWGPAVLIDAVGFIVDDRDHIAKVADLAGKPVCWLEGTPAGETANELLHALGVKFIPNPYQERGEMESALATGHCAAVGGDISQLANIRLSLPALHRHFSVMGQTIGVDPIAPAVSDREPRLAAIVDMVMLGLVEAEAHGITRADAEHLAATSTDPIQRRLLGTDPWTGRALGLPDRWLRDAVEAVGNQSEIYARDVGAGSPLALPVGPNRPVSMGGALLELPVQPSR